MLRLTQILRNLFLRVEGFLSVIFNSFLSVLKGFFSFFAKLFGLTQPDYFLESDEAQGIKQAAPKESVQKKQDNTPVTFVDTSRRANTKKVEDYYINLAREVKKK